MLCKLLIAGSVALAIVVPCGLAPCRLSVAQEQATQVAAPSEGAAAETGAAEPRTELIDTEFEEFEIDRPAPAKRRAVRHEQAPDYWSLLFVFVLSTFIGIGVVGRVSRLLHTPLMSLTNAISAIAVVGAILVTGPGEYPLGIRILGAVALFASMTNIVSGFLITDRMLKMFKQTR